MLDVWAVTADFGGHDDVVPGQGDEGLTEDRLRLGRCVVGRRVEVVDAELEGAVDGGDRDFFGNILGVVGEGGLGAGSRGVKRGDWMGEVADIEESHSGNYNAEQSDLNIYIYIYEANM